MYTIQVPLPVCQDEFLATPDNDRLVLVLNALNLEPLLLRMGADHRWGRRGHGMRVLLRALIAAWVYELHSIAHLRRELLRNASLRLLCGMQSVPAEDAFDRLIARLAEHVDDLEERFTSTVMRLRDECPGLGEHVAIDSTAISAWSEGNRTVPADLDAAWGKKGVSAKGRMGWWFGYKVHIAADTKAEIPLAYTVTPANDHDITQSAPLLDKVEAQQPAGHLTAVMEDAAYDSGDNHVDIWRRGALPIIDLNSRGKPTPDGFDDEHCPVCACTKKMRYLGRDRVYVKYTTGKGCTCQPAGTITRWRIDANIRLHPPLPQHTPTWQKLYNERTSVERVNGRCKGHLRLDGLRHRGLLKVRVHVALSMIVLVAGALGMILHGHREWARTVVRWAA